MTGKTWLIFGPHPVISGLGHLLYSFKVLIWKKICRHFFTFSFLPTFSSKPLKYVMVNLFCFFSGRVARILSQRSMTSNSQFIDWESLIILWNGWRIQNQLHGGLKGIYWAHKCLKLQVKELYIIPLRLRLNPRS